MNAITVTKRTSLHHPSQTCYAHIRCISARRMYRCRSLATGGVGTRAREARGRSASRSEGLLRPRLRRRRTFCNICVGLSLCVRLITHFFRFSYSDCWRFEDSIQIHQCGKHHYGFLSCFVLVDLLQFACEIVMCRSAGNGLWSDAARNFDKLW